MCQAVKDNYYVHENLYFDTWDADSIGNVYRAAYEQGDGFCSVRFADRELYEQAFAYFITDQKIVHYCKGLTSLYYLEDSDQNVLTNKILIKNIISSIQSKVFVLMYVVINTTCNRKRNF